MSSSVVTESPSCFLWLAHGSGLLHPFAGKPMQDKAAKASGNEAQALPQNELAYRRIKRSVLSLEYRPGQFINEALVCKKFGLGRTPVHQAMHRLMLEGLVDIIPRKGIVVRGDSLNEMLELMESRWLIEPHCAGLASERISPKEVEELEGHIALGRNAIENKKLHKLTLDEFMEIDRAFHLGIAASSGNHVLAEIVRSLHERSSRLWSFGVWGAEELSRTQAEHEAILAAIQIGDKHETTAKMQRHLTSVRRRLMRLPERN